MKIKPLDPLIFIVSLAVVVVFSVQAYQGAGEGSIVAVEAEGETWIHQLDEDAVYDFRGPLGSTVIEIDDGAVSVLSSPCRDKICVLSKPAAGDGEWIACLPNKVFLIVKGGSDAAVDAATF